MALPPGTRLGPYEIAAQIGAGGMGEVYRATDTKLKRQVAIKILPPSVAADHDRLARFQREAEVLASLNHPNIAAIHGIEESGGTTALVMELVEGEDLSAIVARGPIPIGDVLPIAKQIADALEAAHEQGIVHRDLKPANIKVRSDGTVKVLDFGLAKAMDPTGASSASASALANSPTITSPAMPFDYRSGHPEQGRGVTQMGMILGTAAYMSPEQAKGRAVDKRSDVWAFGAVLYEMLAGRRAFAGEDVSDTLASVLKADTDWDALPSGVPATVVTVLKRCLQRDPRQRLRDVGDVRLALEGAFETVSSAAPAASAKPRRAALLGVGAAGLILGALAAVALDRALAPTPAAPLVTRFTVTPPADLTLTRVAGQNVAVSPDGSLVVYTATSNGQPILAVRRFTDATVRPIPRTEGGAEPFFSPDSTQIGFVANGKLMRIAVAGGPPLPICDLPGHAALAQPSWGDGGAIVFVGAANASGSMFYRVAETGGTPEPIARTKEAAKGTPRWPHVLPGAESILYTLVPEGGLSEASIVARSLNTGEEHTVVERGLDARYVRTGHLIYGTSDGTLLAVPFDAGRLTATGTAEPMIDGVTVKGGGVVLVDIAANGTLVYVPGGSGDVPTALTWLDRHGTIVGTIGSPQAYGELALSPDGSRIAAFRRDSIGENLWIVDPTRSSSTRLTTDAGNQSYPVWSPDGAQIAFGLVTSGGADLYRKAAGASVQKDLLWKDDLPKVPTDWSRDGRFLLYVTLRDSSQMRGLDIWVLPMTDASPTPIKYLATAFNEGAARFSPDGKWVVYTSDVSKRREVYISPFPDAGSAEPVMVSTAGGVQPRWRPDGRAVFYLNPDRELMEADITPGAPPRVGVPKPLFVAPVKVVAGGSTLLWTWDVTPDGQRFLINPQADHADSPQLMVVTNWLATLD